MLNVINSFPVVSPSHCVRLLRRASETGQIVLLLMAGVCVFNLRIASLLLLFAAISTAEVMLPKPWIILVSQGARETETCSVIIFNKLQIHTCYPWPALLQFLCSR